MGDQDQASEPGAGALELRWYQRLSIRIASSAGILAAVLVIAVVVVSSWRLERSLVEEAHARALSRLRKAHTEGERFPASEPCGSARAEAAGAGMRVKHLAFAGETPCRRGALRRLLEGD